MKKSKKTWAEKLATDHGLPKVEPIPPRLHAKWGKGTLVIAAPREVDALMQKVGKGKLTTFAELQRALAKQHGATMACPMTTGIFANIAAHAADEAEQAGKKRITPYWRTLKSGGELNPKFPGGLAVLRSRLEAEGHTIQVRGKRMFVLDHEKRLVQPGAS
ncbi:MAG: MGMT family protein [Planctomycetes bacterium]|nr:MGMT family protein [Planctomycetota bacterium]